MSVIHLVLIVADVDDAEVARLGADLLAARANGDLAFSTLRLGRRLSPTVRDGLLGGLIDTNGDSRHVLAIECDDAAALDRYYEAPVHARLRRQFLSAVSPDIAAIYARADMDVSNAPALYEEIERRAAAFMTRMDITIE